MAKPSVRLNPRIKTLREMFDLENRDMEALTRGIDKKFIGNRRVIFTTQGASGPDGRWQALSPNYKKWKRKVRPGKKIMQFDGNLKRSLTTRNLAHVARWRRVPVPTVIVGTKDIKAAYHGSKSGNPLANPRVPERDVMAHTTKDVRGYEGVVRDYFVKVKLPRVARVLNAAMKIKGL